MVSFDTLDYQLAYELIDQEDLLLHNPKYYLSDLNPIKITEISKDDDFALDRGCFSVNTSPISTSTDSLCIATSSVYSNWECLKYNKDEKSFIIFYGQVFAD